MNRVFTGSFWAWRREWIYFFNAELTRLPNKLDVQGEEKKETMAPGI